MTRRFNVSSSVRFSNSSLPIEIKSRPSAIFNSCFPPSILITAIGQEGNTLFPTPSLARSKIAGEQITNFGRQPPICLEISNAVAIGAAVDTTAPALIIPNIVTGVII